MSSASVQHTKAHTRSIFQKFYVAKIGDFGQSRLIESKTDELTKCPGNASFMPPEAQREFIC